MKKINITFDEVKTQTDAIKWHLKTYGNITSWQAIKEYGATRLSAIIFNLRDEGYNIITENLEVKNRFDRTVVIAKYLYFKPIQQYKQQEIIWG
tara:strand:+ start:1563 stop:1844 length:282 start_codon:yes stop_codon:yes gene_type:complete